MLRRSNYCHSCQRDFNKNLLLMERHNLWLHKKKIHVCNECGSAFTPAELDLHTRDVHREMQPGDIKCNVCATVSNPGDQTCRVCRKFLIGNAAEGAGLGDGHGHGEGQGQGQGQGEDDGDEDGDEEGEDEDAAEDGNIEDAAEECYAAKEGQGAAKEGLGEDDGDEEGEDEDAAIKDAAEEGYAAEEGEGEGDGAWNPGMPDIETETNAIDRTVAHLLFHRPLELPGKLSDSDTAESPISTKLPCEHKVVGSLNLTMGCLPESSKSKQNLPHHGLQNSYPLPEPQHIDQFKNSPCMDATENASNDEPADGGARDVEASK